MTNRTCCLCKDDIAYCACWRCIECEELFTEETPFTYDSEWGWLCPFCAAEGIAR